MIRRISPSKLIGFVGRCLTWFTILSILLLGIIIYIGLKGTP